MHRRDFVKLSVALPVAGLAMAAAFGRAQADWLKKPTGNEPAGEDVNVGFLAALSGPDAGWGLPGITGNQMFIDEVNADGGLLVDGKRHKLVINPKFFDGINLAVRNGHHFMKRPGVCSRKKPRPRRLHPAIMANARLDALPH